MKRLIALSATAITLLSLASCSAVTGEKGSVPNGLAESFKADVSIDLDELDAEGSLRRYGNGMWEVEFTSPNTLSGVKLSFDEGNAEASYKGLKFTVPQSALPVKAMMLNLIEAVDGYSNESELTGKEEEGNIELKGTLEGGDYILEIDRQGKIVSFEMPNNKLDMEFENVTSVQAEETPAEENTESTSEETSTTVST
ncbi:MAG: hypothetical protein E7500_08240 [Ruminococcus sp.]|nr:hypothetical protein [Ruminococcus sp.]